MALFELPDALGPGGMLAIVAVGLVAGFINVTAGGGSLLAMPLLIFLGLPATVANGTVRLALLVQNASAIWRYKREGALDLRFAARLVVPALVGAGFGAALGSLISNAGFRDVLGWVMLGAALLVVLGPGRVIRHGRNDALAHRREQARWVWPTLFVVGFYGGFIQAGVGYLILFAMTFLLGLELVEANIMKVVLVFAYTPIALGIFLSYDKVRLWPGLLLAVGQGLGGWVAAAAALKRGASFIRAMLAIAVFLTAFELLGVRAGLAQLLAGL